PVENLTQWQSLDEAAIRSKTPSLTILPIGIFFASTQHPRHGPCGRRGGMAYRILLVEDDADFREPLAILLSQDGYHVQAAVNGQEALEGLAGQSYDIIVSDLRMPGIDGEQLFRRIEREWPHPASRVVMMTAERPTR